MKKEKDNSNISKPLYTWIDTLIKIVLIIIMLYGILKLRDGFVTEERCGIARIRLNELKMNDEFIPICCWNDYDICKTACENFLSTTQEKNITCKVSPVTCGTVICECEEVH